MTPDGVAARERSAVAAPGAAPLCVDLDGTLLRTDSESVPTTRSTLEARGAHTRAVLDITIASIS